MKNAWKTLKAFLAEESADDSEDLDTPEKGAAKKKPFKKDDSDDEDSDDDSEEKEKKPAKKKKADAVEPDPETEKEDKTDEKEADAIGSVRLALDDYNGLLALATSAKSANAENKKLKAKADKWDAYQAALSGGKPAADSAGAKAEEKEDAPVDEYAGLRTKYGSLMSDV